MQGANRPFVLGIETSCDETAAAIVAADRHIIAETVLSQLAEHRPFGGVVPEIAARAHVQALDRLIAATLEQAGLRLCDLDAIAATAGPGLIGGLVTGLLTGKALASVIGRPLHAINHLEGHALTARLTDGVAFPYLLLLVSGGHCQLLLVEGVGCYRRLGTTIDDALGEAFDKVAKMLGLGYPGGPAVERAAESGDPSRFALPTPLLGRAEPNFSFSGLKTAVRRHIVAQGPAALHPPLRDDLCAAFQAAAFASVVDRTACALKRERAAGVTPSSLVVAGGVAANRALHGALHDLAARCALPLVVPPARLCTDNAVMIAWAAQERIACGLPPEPLAPARARWPLDLTAEPLLGRGSKGGKA